MKYHDYREKYRFNKRQCRYKVTVTWLYHNRLQLSKSVLFILSCANENSKYKVYSTEFRYDLRITHGLEKLSP